MLVGFDLIVLSCGKVPRKFVDLFSVHLQAIFGSPTVQGAIFRPPDVFSEDEVQGCSKNTFPGFARFPHITVETKRGRTFQEQGIHLIFALSSS